MGGYYQNRHYVDRVVACKLDGVKRRVVVKMVPNRRVSWNAECLK